MKLREIRAFLVVAEELNFRRSAERLNVTQPALSRTIRQLEQRIGAHLFSRTTRRVQLTGAGEVFFSKARAGVEMIDEASVAACQAAAGFAGNLSIGYTNFAVHGPMVEIVEAFRQRHPRIEVKLRREATDDQIQEIASGQLDMGFIVPPVGPCPTELMRAWSERLCAVLYSAHPLAARETIKLCDLAQDRLILGNIGSWRPYRRRIESLCTAAGFVARNVRDAHTTLEILGLVAAEAGVTILPESVRTSGRRGLIFRPLQDDDNLIETLLAWRHQNVSPFVASFIDLTRQLSNLLPGGLFSPEMTVPPLR